MGITRRLAEFDSMAAFELQTLPAGTYEKELLIEGNSLLATLWVSYLDPGASIIVSYSDSTTGTSEGESYLLASHPSISVAPATSRILVTKIHNRPIANVQIVGGAARFGVYVTVVSSFASDLDSALKYELQLADFLRDKGLPVMGLDDTTGVFQFIRSKNGRLYVELTGDVDANFTQIGKKLYGRQNPALLGVPYNLISYTVPAGKQFTWLSGQGSGDTTATWRVSIDGIPWLTARNAYDQRNVMLGLVNPLLLTTGQQMIVEATSSSLRSLPGDIEAWIYGVETAI